MGKAWCFFFRSTPCLFLEVHQVNCPAAQMFFLNENFWKNIKGYSHRPTRKNGLFQRVLSFNVSSVNSL